MSWLRENWSALALPAGVLLVALGAWTFLSPEPLEGEAASGFSLPILAGPGSDRGDRISVSSFEGEVLVLDFWASWCPPCAQSIPIMNRIDQMQGVHVVGVNTESFDQGQLQEAHRQFQASFPSVQDADGQLSNAYRVSQLPTTVVIDGRGQVAKVEIGIPDEEELRSFIEGLGRSH